jgi:hypothetical protein
MAASTNATAGKVPAAASSKNEFNELNGKAGFESAAGPGFWNSRKCGQTEKFESLFPAGYLKSIGPGNTVRVQLVEDRPGERVVDDERRPGRNRFIGSQMPK